MISAIAARKAAQAQQQQQQAVVANTKTNSSPSPSPSPPPLLPLGSQKRGPPSTKHAAKPPSKKQKKGTGKERNGSPRADGGGFVAQAEVILIESDDEEEEEGREDASRNVSSGSDGDLLRPTTRAWSPSAPLHDSSDDEEEGEEDAEMADSELISLPARFARPIKMNIGGPLSTFVSVPGQNTFHLSADDAGNLDIQVKTRGTAILLAPGQKLCILGTCRLTLLRGTISVNGTTLYPSKRPHNIFAPRSSPLPVIEGRSENSNAPAVDISSLPPSLRLEAASAIILLQELRSNVESLGRVCQTFDGVYRPSGWQEGSVSSPFQLDGLYLVSQQTRDVCPFNLPASWSTALSIKNIPSPSHSSIFLIKGPKKCGKSAFAKTLFNTLLTRYQRVAFLECDVGQSEFTPGGMVALNIISHPVFGPPFTHPSVPFRAHYIGATTPRSSPMHYLDAIRDLVQTYRLEIQSSRSDGSVNDDVRISDEVPLVVNTMGWAKGLGADLTQKIEEMVEPGQIFEFQSEDHISSSSSFSPNTYHLEPAPLSTLSTSFLATDHRTMSILSYFHSLLPNLEPGELGESIAQAWDVTVPLCAMLPYEVDVRVAVDRIVLTGAGSEDVVPREIARVLNGAIVGLAEPDYHYHHHHAPPPNETKNNTRLLPYTQNEPPPSPSDSSCIGLALIRALEPPFLHLLTPIPPKRLSGLAVVLVKGEMELPVLGMLDFRSVDGKEVAGVELKGVPYLQWGRVSEGVIGAERRRVRRNLMRRGLA